MVPRRLAASACARVVSSLAHSRSPATVGLGFGIAASDGGFVTVRLMTRHWVITDGQGEVQEVQGAGVIGSQPLIAPGDKFAYTSACPLQTPVGTMSGSYEMEVEDGSNFKVEIPAFTLAMPYSLN